MPDKKVIFITQENVISDFKKQLTISMEKLPLEEYKDKEFTLNDLTIDSQREILKQEVTFQGEKISLDKLINENNNELKSKIDSETLTKLIKKDKIIIGEEFKYLYVTKKSFLWLLIKYKSFVA